MRFLIARLSILALGTALAASAAATPVLSRDGQVPAFQFPSMPDMPPQWAVPNRGIPSANRNPGGNPGITAPLVEPPKSDKADGKAPATQADRLNDLFQRLAQASDGDEASGLALAIEHVWLVSGSDTADLLMVRAVTALGKGNSDLALKLLDKIVVIDPTWAEAWNKRATLRFLGGDDPGAMDDIAHVLILEPRHFGALSGMGFILQRNGMKKEALALVRKAMSLYPHNAELEKLNGDLGLEVEGREI